MDQGIVPTKTGNSGSIGESKSSEDHYRALVRKAYDLLSEYNYKQAASMFRQAFRVAPDTDAKLFCLEQEQEANRKKISTRWSRLWFGLICLFIAALIGLSLEAIYEFFPWVLTLMGAVTYISIIVGGIIMALAFAVGEHEKLNDLRR